MQAEEGLDFIEKVAKLTAAGFVRWVLVRADPERRIVAETVHPMQAITWLGAYPKAAVEEESPQLLAAWADVDHRYFTARHEATGELYVHTEAADEPWLIEALHAVQDLGVKGPRTPARSRAEQVTESDAHAQALAAWDLDDDSLVAPRMIGGARERLAFVADRRAKLRWGMLPVSDN
jgi:hypothetical protein